MINFEVLGPVRASRGAWAADLSPQQQLLLAALVMAAGKPVPRTQIARVLWDEPDEAPEGALKRVVAELRKQLRAALPAGDPLPAMGEAYYLPLDERQADVLRFRAKVNAARRATGREATRLLAEALREWGDKTAGLFGGQPLTGLRGRWADSIRENLRAEHRDARYECLWGDFKGGQYDQVARECRQLADEPDALADERFLELWMVATYRAGHRTEVQQIYERAVASADAHLGMKLSGRVHELAKIIRNEDRQLDGPGGLLERASIAYRQISPDREGSMNDATVNFNNHDHAQVANQIGQATAPVTVYMGTSPEPAGADLCEAPDPPDDDEPGA